MAASLRPAVSEVAPRRDIRRVTAFHTGGLLLGGMTSGLVLATLGAAVRTLRVGIVVDVVVGLTLILAGGQILGLRLPQSKWQVPEYWRRFFDVDVLPLAYGGLLGLGILTAVVVGAFWVFVALTLAVSPGIALAGWCAYALGRAGGFRAALAMRADVAMVMTSRRRWAVNAGTLCLAVLAVVLSGT